MVPTCFHGITGSSSGKYWRNKTQVTMISLILSFLTDSTWKERKHMLRNDFSDSKSPCLPRKRWIFFFFKKTHFCFRWLSRILSVHLHKPENLLMIAIKFFLVLALPNNANIIKRNLVGRNIKSLLMKNFMFYISVWQQKYWILNQLKILMKIIS